MISAELIACIPATPYAKSALNFFCTAPTPPDVWAASAAWASVLVTIGMAILAAMAWRTSQKALRASLEQIEVAKDAEFNREQEQILGNFTDSLVEAFSHRGTDTPGTISSQTGRMYSASTRWALFHGREDAFEILTGISIYLEQRRLSALRLMEMVDESGSLPRSDWEETVLPDLSIYQRVLTHGAVRVHMNPELMSAYLGDCQDVWQELKSFQPFDAMEKPKASDQS